MHFNDPGRFDPPDHEGYTIKVTAERPDSQDARLLVDHLWAYLDTLYGPNLRSRFTPEQIDTPGRIFVVARIDGAPVGCGAILPLTVAHDDGTPEKIGEEICELKRMWVEAEHRRRGVALTVLGALEQMAVLKGWPALRLETGIRQPEAIAFYRQANYLPIPCWGPYKDDPISRCFEKRFGASMLNQ